MKRAAPRTPISTSIPCSAAYRPTSRCRGSAEWPKFQHLPQHGDPPPRRASRAARRSWTAPPPGSSYSNRSRSTMPLCSRRSPRILPGVQAAHGSRSRSGGMPNTRATASAASRFITPCRPGQRALEIRRRRTRNRTVSAPSSTSSARTSALSANPKVTDASAVHVAKRRHPRVVGIQHRDAIRRQLFDQLALGRAPRLRWNRRTPRARTRRW